jgi:hypothetical protein
MINIDSDRKQESGIQLQAPVDEEQEILSKAAFNDRPKQANE